jgi:hypothetical protein
MPSLRDLKILFHRNAMFRNTRLQVCPSRTTSWTARPRSLLRNSCRPLKRTRFFPLSTSQHSCAGLMNAVASRLEDFVPPQCDATEFRNRRLRRAPPEQQAGWRGCRCALPNNTLEGAAEAARPSKHNLRRGSQEAALTNTTLASSPNSTPFANSRTSSSTVRAEALGQETCWARRSTPYSSSVSLVASLIPSL